MSIRDILNYTIIDTDKLTISVYNVLLVCFILFATVIVLKIIRQIFRGFSESGKLDKSTSWSIFQIVKYFIWVIVLVIVIESVGVDISILLASIAALLVGVGLGIQQLFNDLASGLILLIERNLKIDDVIQLEDDGIVGRVINIGLRTSEIKTRDDIIMIIPNSKFVNERIINWSHVDQKTRFEINVGVAYSSDVRLVEKILIRCAESSDRISKDIKPFVRFENFGDSSLDFKLFFWADHLFEIEKIKSDIRFNINESFKENEIQIPFPQRDVNMRKFN
jgi:small-conductance mechanosensitive channel